jgi:hypothetical protein
MNRIVQPLIVLLILLACLPATAQDSLRQSPPDSIQGLDPSDSVVISKDGKVTTIESYAARYNPRKAMLFAAVVPGLGQVYNKKYWKVPLVYAGFAGIGYGIKFNQDLYLIYRKGLFSLLNEPPNPVVDPETGLTALGNKVIGGEAVMPRGEGATLKRDVVRNAVNRYRRDRDFAVIACFIFYMMQMVDAHVDAHLKEFDLNPQLKVSIEPAMNQNAFTGRSAGVGLTLKF